MKVLDAERTYTLRNWRGYWTGTLEAWQGQANDRELSHLAWVPDDVWTVSPRHIGDDSHGVLVAGQTNHFWPSSWLRLSEPEQEAAVDSVVPEKVLALTGHDSRAGWVGDIPIGVIRPAELVGEWDSIVGPIRRKRAEAERRADAEFDAWRAKREAWDRQYEKDQAEIARLRTGTRRVKWLMGITAAAWVVAAVTGHAGQSAPPFGTALAGLAIAMLAIHSRIKKLKG